MCTQTTQVRTRRGKFGFLFLFIKKVLVLPGLVEALFTLVLFVPFTYNNNTISNNLFPCNLYMDVNNSRLVMTLVHLYLVLLPCQMLTGIKSMCRIID
jgi:hypothetical protein